MQKQVEDFHRTFGVIIGDRPAICSDETMRLRFSLIEEEYEEFKAAAQRGDLVEAIDALMDLLYVTFGTCVSMGIDAEKFFDEVQRSNMSKVWPDGKVHYREDGKVIKSPEYSPVDFSTLLEPA